MCENYVEFQKSRIVESVKKINYQHSCLLMENKIVINEYCIPAKVNYKGNCLITMQPGMNKLSCSVGGL